MATTKPIHGSLKEYGRGLTGGLLFSLPMLYTMELWWAGFIVNSMQLLLYFIIGIALLVLYNRYVGIRKDNSYLECLLESFEEMGVAILLTVFILWITGRISNLMSLTEISGKVIVEAVTVAIGISVGKSQLGSNGEDEKEEESTNEKSKEKPNASKRPDVFRNISIAFCGAILIASNVAPTEEIVVIALESETFKIFTIALISMVIGGSVLYYINFTGTEKRKLKQNHHAMALTGTLIMYAIALASSAFMLWFFGRFTGMALEGIIAETIVLGFPAAIGASAGRLLIQT